MVTSRTVSRFKPRRCPAFRAAPSRPPRCPPAPRLFGVILERSLRKSRGRLTTPGPRPAARLPVGQSTPPMPATACVYNRRARGAAHGREPRPDNSGRDGHRGAVPSGLSGRRDPPRRHQRFGHAGPAAQGPARPGGGRGGGQRRGRGPGPGPAARARLRAARRLPGRARRDLGVRAHPGPSRDQPARDRHHGPVLGAHGGAGLRGGRRRHPHQAPSPHPHPAAGGAAPAPAPPGEPASPHGAGGGRGGQRRHHPRRALLRVSRDLREPGVPRP